MKVVSCIGIRHFARHFLIILIAFIPPNIAAQAKINWSAKELFEQKVFVENKGQILSQAISRKNILKSESIKYTVSFEGVELYFTNAGLTYRKDEYEQKREERNGGDFDSAQPPEEEKEAEE